MTGNRLLHPRLVRHVDEVHRRGRRELLPARQRADVLRQDLLQGVGGRVVEEDPVRLHDVDVHLLPAECRRRRPTAVRPVTPSAAQSRFEHGLGERSRGVVLAARVPVLQGLHQGLPALRHGLRERDRRRLVRRLVRRSDPGRRRAHQQEGEVHRALVIAPSSAGPAGCRPERGPGYRAPVRRPVAGAGEGMGGAGGGRGGEPAWPDRPARPGARHPLASARLAGAERSQRGRSTRSPGTSAKSSTFNVQRVESRQSAHAAIARSIARRRGLRTAR